MILVTKLAVLGILVAHCEANTTRIKRKNILLSRERRYLMFPKGSNFVINLTCTKPLLRAQPTGWNTVYEVDFPFALPPDTRNLFFKQKPERRVIEKRNVIENIEKILAQTGVNSTSCINRFICESKQYAGMKQNSLLNHLVDVVFRSFTEEEQFPEYKDACESTHFELCPLSLFNLFTATPQM
ncbi:uncharacterized protein LOC132708072 [Cylas formicarius]|uniref:uncharacterized protein LOC132708072 n=1 Tax=Cylas formicarius TaxID=197179 RepID=UPI002958933C|nr:uncharacterized protein LOC132708072 [Cylas formicarius]